MVKRFVTVGALALVLALLGLTLRSWAPFEPEVELATLQVESVPRGAEIHLDGQPTGRTTPATLELPVGQSRTVEVAREGYLSRPLQHVVVVAPSAPPLRFDLVPQVRLRVGSLPSGAVIEIDGRRLGQAPVTAFLERGREHRISAAATDHLDRELRWVAATDDAVTLELEPSVQIEVASSPSPATILVDGEVRGETPGFFDVPAERSFSLVAQRAGYRDAERRVEGRRLEHAASLLLPLQPLPLSALPLSPDERREVRRMMADLRQARRARQRARLQRDRAAEALEASTDNFRKRARLDGIIDRAQTRLEGLESAIADLEGQLEGIRDVVSRRDGEAGLR